MDNTDVEILIDNVRSQKGRPTAEFREEIAKALEELLKDRKCLQKIVRDADLEGAYWLSK